jgi:hypothetical protein
MAHLHHFVDGSYQGSLSGAKQNWLIRRVNGSENKGPIPGPHKQAYLWTDGLSYLATLSAASAGGALGSQTVFLGLRAEEAPVLKFSQYAGVLYRCSKSIYQAFCTLTVSGRYIGHSNLLY